MQEKLAELLRNERLRLEIAEKGYRKATTIRTYDHLAAQICEDWAKIKGFY
jgi:spore maturation protein CgeB